MLSDLKFIINVIFDKFDYKNFFGCGKLKYINIMLKARHEVK